MARDPADFWRIVQRIAGRFEPRVARRFEAAIRRMRARIDRNLLAAAVRSGSVDRMIAAAGSDDVAVFLIGLEDDLAGATRATASANARVLSAALGVDVSFRAVDASSIIYARRQVGRMVVAINDDVRDAIRIVTATAQRAGLTVVDQARMIETVVGLPPPWANAPANLGREILEGRVNYGRRLSGADKAMIRSRIARGTVDGPFVDRMMRRYSDRLVRRRALNIARTETMAAANWGQRESWREGVRDGALPNTARRVWIVTPDDRLRDTHAAVPFRNPDGVPIDGGVYDTPVGPSDGPPLEPLCRCSEGLVFPGLAGVL